MTGIDKKLMEQIDERLLEHVFRKGRDINTIMGQHKTGGIMARTKTEIVDEEYEFVNPFDGSKTIGSNAMMDYLFFPRYEDLDKFRRSGKELVWAGPAESHPGAVGSITVFKQGEGDKSIFHVYTVQSGYKVGEHVNRSLSSKYAGWRDHLVRLALQDAAKRGFKRLMLTRRDEKTEEDKETGPDKLAEQAFKNEATKLGFKIKVKEDKILAEK